MCYYTEDVNKCRSSLNNVYIVLPYQYKEVEMEFNENDLDNVVAGVPRNLGEEKALEHSGYYGTSQMEDMSGLASDELTEEELDNITAGYPNGLDEDNKPKLR